MRVTVIVAAVVAILGSAVAVTLGQGKPASTQSMKGVWRAVSTVRVGADPRSNLDRQPGILIYTDSHYCLLVQDNIVSEAQRRPVPPPKDPNNLTSAEKIALYEQWRPLGAQCGRYTVKGNTYTHHPIIAKAPPAKGTTYPDANPVEFKLEGNTLLQMNRAADGKTVTTRTYARLE